ncbi:MAG: hypothetical protein JWO40_140 [Candidatus Doudnabacteria bacterium]|nr:hypothetical protein [Candidatus Doudnabacteria bacterium]
MSGRTTQMFKIRPNTRVRAAIAILALAPVLTACNSEGVTGVSANPPTYPGPAGPTIPKKTCSDDPTTGQPCINGYPWSSVGAIDLPNAVTAMLVTPDDKTAYVGEGNLVQQYAVLTDSLPAVRLQAVGSPIGIASNGRQFTLCNGQITAPYGTSGISMIDPATQTSITLPTLTNNKISSLSCSPGNSILVITDTNGAVLRYNYATKTTLPIIRDTTRMGVPAFAAQNPSGTAFIAANFSERYQSGQIGVNSPMLISLTNSNTNGVYFPSSGAALPINGVTYGSWAATISEDKNLRVYDAVLPNGQFPEHCMMPLPGIPTTVTAADNSNLLAVGVPFSATGNKVIIYRANPGRQAGCDKIFEADNSVANSPIKALHFSASGAHLFVASGNRIIVLVANK